MRVRYGNGLLRPSGRLLPELEDRVVHHGRNDIEHHCYPDYQL